MEQGDALFSTWGVWLEERDPLASFCDGSMHWECYGAWPERAAFAAGYFEFWVENERHSLFWNKAYLDEGVLVTVNPSAPVESAWVYLKETGSRISVKLEEWDRWVRSAPRRVHEVEMEAVAKVKARLLINVPTRELLVARLDPEAKRAVVEEHEAMKVEHAKEQEEARKEMDFHNDACERLHRRIARYGFECKHCRKRSKEYRLSRKWGCKSAIICLACGWVVGV